MTGKSPKNLDTHKIVVIIPKFEQHVVLNYLQYHKNPKNSDTQKIWCNHPKIWTTWIYRWVMRPKDAEGIANSVDPDQTAPLGAVWSGSALLSRHICPKT